MEGPDYINANFVNVSADIHMCDLFCVLVM